MSDSSEPRRRTPSAGGRRARRRPTPADVVGHRRSRAASRHGSAGPARYLPRSEEFSAGGLVVDSAPTPSAAIIGRTDRRGRLLWSLPKGHIEPGETPVQAAVREVEEETGIRGRVIAPLGEIKFWFVADGRRVHKTVAHFLMTAVGGELSDDDPEVEAVAWVPVVDLSQRLAYADERQVAVDALRLLSDIA